MGKKMVNYSGMFDYFSVLVIGENPDEQMYKFDMMEDTSKPYIIYSYSDLNKIRKNRIAVYEEFLTKSNDEKIIKTINENLEKLRSLSDLEFYTELGELYMYDEYKNIISTENPYGRWITCEKGGKIFSNYLKDFNGNGVISAKKKDIDWSLIHLPIEKVNLYNRTWDLCVEKITPETDKDRDIIKNMSHYKNYFSRYVDKNAYIKFSCSFWTYSVTYTGGWTDMENRPESDWIINFYDRFIKNLPDDTLITIYECTK